MNLVHQDFILHRSSLPQQCLPVGRISQEFPTKNLNLLSLLLLLYYYYCTIIIVLIIIIIIIIIIITDYRGSAHVYGRGRARARARVCVCVCVCVCVLCSCILCVTLCSGDRYFTPLVRKSASKYTGGECTKTFGKQNKLYLVTFEVFFLVYGLAIGNIRVIRNLGLLLRVLLAWNCCDRSVMMNRCWNPLGFCNRRP